MVVPTKLKLSRRKIRSAKRTYVQWVSRLFDLKMKTASMIRNQSFKRSLHISSPLPLGEGSRGVAVTEAQGINSLYTMIQGLFHQVTLLDVIRNFVYLPDTSRREEKILCRYPQYYAATKLYRNILQHMRPEGDGKGGTYFGATGCGKSFTMLFLARLLMKSVALSSPTIVLITGPHGSG